jgi:subtilisin-like proprotein convertase family protein
MRRFSVVVVALALFGLVRPSFADARGLDVRVLDPGSMAGSVALEFQWHVSSELATLSAMRSDGAAVYVSEFGRLESTDDVSLGQVHPGQVDSVHVEVGEENPVTFAITWQGDQASFQLVGTLRRVDGAVELSRTHRYRITETHDPERRATTIMQIEPLDPKTAATIFGEDSTNVAIPDATGAAGECDPSNFIWAVQRRINVSTAPAAATADAIAVHVMITHPNMSHLEVAFFEETSNTGFFLWNEGGGVNLNQTFTQSLYGQDLPGIGEDVNGWYQLNTRDCTVGTTGTLTYWSVEVTYTEPNAIDLVASSISVDPNTVEPGGDLAVEWQGEVAGSGTVSGSFNAGIYLSGDSSVTTGDVLLASVNVASATTPGDTFGDGAPGRTVTIPGTLTNGTYFVGVIIDSGNTESETNENNNVVTTSVQVREASVDLVADSLVAQTSTVAPGASVPVNWFGRVDAASTGPAPSNYTVGFYLSADMNINGADLLLDRETVSALNPGDSFGASGKSLVIPVSTSAGNWFIGMWVDDTEGVGESNEGNNVATTPITVTGASGSPDLVPSNCSVSPSTVEPGGSVTVQFRASNSGTEAAAASTAGVYLSADTVFQGGSDQGLATAPVTALPAGQNGGNQSVAVTVPGGTADGSWHTLVVLDINGNVAEGNEGNNVCSAALTVQSGGAPAATRWLIPAVASVEGAENSDWRSQTTVVNPTAGTRTATYYYVASGQSWPGTLLRGPVSLAPSQADFLEDPLVTLRPASGLVYVDLDDEGPVVTSRTYNLSPGGATFGQGIPALRLDGDQDPDSYILPMVHSGDGNFRTNLGIVQASGGTLTVRIDIYAATGVLMASENRSQDAAWRQINDVFRSFGLGASVVNGGWIRVTKISAGSGAWTCYASVVDDQTGDPTFVAPIAE